MAQFFTFQDSSFPTVEQVGGKGLSLIYSEKKGFKVPPTLVLSTAFFQPWMARLKVTPEWNAFTQASDDGIAAAAKAVHESAAPW